MRFFLSAGEPSGDLHGANLARALQQHVRDIECVGFGGERMEAAGCRLLYPLCRLAVIGFVRVSSAHVAWPSPDSCARPTPTSRTSGPTPSSSSTIPGSTGGWPAGPRRTASRSSTSCRRSSGPGPAGASKKMRRFVDHVLCSSPSRSPGISDRGVAAHYVGHPYFDELPQQQLNAAFVEAEAGAAGHGHRPAPGLAQPGAGRENLTTLLGAARRIHADPTGNALPGRLLQDRPTTARRGAAARAQAARSRPTRDGRRRSSIWRRRRSRSRDRSAWSCSTAASLRSSSTAYRCRCGCRSSCWHLPLHQPGESAGRAGALPGVPDAPRRGRSRGRTSAALAER